MQEYLVYLKKYCQKHAVSEEEAEQHAVVKAVKTYYELKIFGDLDD